MFSSPRVGALNRPAVPNIKGLADFAGPGVPHRAVERSDVDLNGKRVAMIGTGASGMQTAPSIAADVAQLTIFQRSPHWAIRHPLYHAAVSEDVKWVIRHVPYLCELVSLPAVLGGVGRFPSHAADRSRTGARRTFRSTPTTRRMREDLIDYIKSKIGDRPDLLAKDDSALSAVRQAHAARQPLVRDAEASQRRRWSPRRSTTSSRTRSSPPTGHATRSTSSCSPPASRPRACWGRSRSTDERASGCATRGARTIRAPISASRVPDYPNFFMIYGPNTNLAHGGSAIFHSECQIRYAMEGIRELIETGAQIDRVPPRAV